MAGQDLTVGKHHRLVVLIESRPTHVTDKPAVTAVGEGKVVSQSVEDRITDRTLGVLLRGSLQAQVGMT